MRLQNLQSEWIVVFEVSIQQIDDSCVVELRSEDGSCLLLTVEVNRAMKFWSRLSYSWRTPNGTSLNDLNGYRPFGDTWKPGGLQLKFSLSKVSEL